MCEVLSGVHDAEECWTHSFGSCLLNGRVFVVCLCVLRECRDKEGQGLILKKITVWYPKADAHSWPQ